MKRPLRLASLLLMVTAALPATATERNWSTGTAYTLPKGRLEIGLFQPFRKGQTERLEWSTHPVFNLKIPNIRIKMYHSKLYGWDVATRHSLVYPTPLLRLLRVKGFGISSLRDMDVGGIITSDPDVPPIPHMISSRNEILFSRWLGSSSLLTGKLGVAVALKRGKLDRRTTIDLPIVFPRLGVYYHGYSVNLGIDLLRGLTKRVDYLIDADVLLLPNSEEDFAFEHKGLFLWNRSSRFQVAIGYKLVYGEYPFGTRWHLFPLFDLQWGRQSSPTMKPLL